MDLNQKTVLVTGFNGFVGSHLTRAFLMNGMEVVGFSLKKKPLDIKFLSKKFHDFYGDIRDREKLELIFYKYRPVYCVHLAGKSTVEDGQKNPGDTFEINIKGAINILELAKKYRLARIVIASTSHVYGANPKPPFKEEFFPQPSRPYETSKTCVDLISQSYADTFNMPVEIPRFTNIYGPGDVNFSRLIPKVMKQIITGGKLHLWLGKTVRDYLYIGDAVAAYLSLLMKRNYHKNKIVNFGSGCHISVSSLVKKIIAVSGKKVLIKEETGKREMEIKRQYLTVGKAKKIFNWQAETPLSEGLKISYRWYNSMLNP